MRPGLRLLIFLGLVLGSKCAMEPDLQVAPRHVCDVVNQIHQLKGRRVVVRGILSWENRHGTMALFDCRPHECPGYEALRFRPAPKETRSASGAVDESFDRMMNELPKQPVNQMIVTFEGTLTVEDDPLVPISGTRKCIVMLVTSVRSMQPVPLGQKRSNYCD